MKNATRYEKKIRKLLGKSQGPRVGTDREEGPVQILIRSVLEEDADGKIVAYLFRAPDGLLVNLEVIRAGFAVTDTGYDFDQKETFIEYQDRARKADKGIYGLVKRIRARNANR